jgi:hypothetical protein
MDNLKEWASATIWFLSSLSLGTTSLSLNQRIPFPSTQKMLGLLFLHLSFDMKNTHIGLLKLNDLTSKRAINSNIVEHCRMQEMG